MKDRLQQKLSLFVVCLLCLILVGQFTSGLEGAEFSAGRLTGVLVTMSDLGFLLFVVALFSMFFLPRFGSAVVISAALVNLPIYFYCSTPGPFRFIVGGTYSVPLVKNFAWTPGSLFGILFLMLALYVGFRDLHRERNPMKEIDLRNLDARRALKESGHSPC